MILPSEQNTNKLEAFTLFAGGGGMDIALKLAGINPIGGIEYDERIANVAIKNGFHITIANILDCKPSDYKTPDFLHASPPCPNFSTAKTNAEETPLDISLANKIVEFLTAWQPKYFTLENVWGYRKSKSWGIIVNALYRLGYGVTVDHINFADYGVPQSRKRMIVRAIKGAVFMPYLPPKQVRIGWYEAVKDLIPTFERDSFADWQIDRLPEMYQDCLVEGRAGGKRDLIAKSVNDPSMTITTSSEGNVYRCFLVDGANASGEIAVRKGGEPIYTITSSMYKAPVRFQSEGNVYRLSPRALARLQTFPDSYQLPESKTLACRIIGNAVPPVGMAHIIKSMIT